MVIPEAALEPEITPVRVGINGFGRIGRNFFRANTAQGNPLEIVAANDLTDPEQLGYLLEYDSLSGKLDSDVYVDTEALYVDGSRMAVLKETEPSQLPWGDLGVDVVIEATGKFTESVKAEQHLKAGAKKVIISAPAKDRVPTFVMGINHDSYLPERDHIISNASCTTNSLAPLAFVLDYYYNIKSGIMVTTHAYTADQNLHDGPHKEDNRRARAAAENIVPSSTGAAKAIGLVLPNLAGKLDGSALRVPVPIGSLTTLTAITNEKVPSVGVVNDLYERAANNRLRGILHYSKVPLVSKDIVGNPHSAIFDAGLTMLVGDQIQVSAWYDNEWGFSNRLVELTKYVGDRLVAR